MKTTRNILTALISAGLPGVAVLTLTNLVPLDLALAGISAVGLVAFAIDDFSRSTTPLRVRAAIIRPSLNAADRPDSATYRKAA